MSWSLTGAWTIGLHRCVTKLGGCFCRRQYHRVLRAQPVPLGVPSCYVWSLSSTKCPIPLPRSDKGSGDLSCYTTSSSIDSSMSRNDVVSVCRTSRLRILLNCAYVLNRKRCSAENRGFARQSRSQSLFKLANR